MTHSVFIIAGEASGDVLGASIMRDMPQIRFDGIGGDHMTALGLKTLFPMTDLSVMGVAEVVTHLPRLVSRLNMTVDAVMAQKPDILLTVDSPDFCLRVAKKIRKKLPHTKIIHMVAPTVWAWRPGRAKKIARFLDGLMCLFPFEPPFFTKHGLRTAFVGHPLVGTLADHADANMFRVRHGIIPDAPVLCLLPGSRVREVTALWPVFVETVRRLRGHMPHLHVVVPTLPHIRPMLTGLDQAVFVTDSVEKYAAMRASTAALHASGTVALELALCGVPMVTAYRVSAFSAWLGRKLLTTKYVNLVNILLNSPVVPEMLQQNAVPDELTHVMHALLTNDALRSVQRDDLGRIAPLLTPPSPQAGADFVRSFLPQ